MKFLFEKPLEQMTPEEREKAGHQMLREVKDFYGSWKEVMFEIEVLEDADIDAAFERSQQDY